MVIGAIASLVASLAMQGGLLVLLFVAWRFGRFAVLAFFLVAIALLPLRSRPEPTVTVYGQGSARVTVSSNAPDVIRERRLSLVPGSQHDDAFGYHIEYRPRSDREDQEPALWFFGGDEDEPLALGVLLRDGRWATGTEGEGCAFDLVDDDPERSFAGRVRCDRMMVDSRDEHVDLAFEVLFTASP